MKTYFIYKIKTNQQNPFNKMKKFNLIQIIVAILLLISTVPLALVVLMLSAIDFNTKKMFGIFFRLISYYSKSYVEWKDENYKHGIDLGYPKCCVNSFCLETPKLLNNQFYYRTQDDKLRYYAGCVNGQFTGFIPCKKCANKVNSGKILLVQLIKNRKPEFGEFKFEQYQSK